MNISLQIKLNNAGGALLQNSGVTIDDADNLAGKQGWRN